MQESIQKTAILIIDDEAAYTTIFRDYLDPDKYTVTYVNTVLKGLKALENNFYNLILADIRIPDILRSEFTSFIKTNYTRTEVIILTSNQLIDKAIDALKLGIDEYLIKPFTRDTLRFSINRALKRLELRSTDDSYVSDEFVANNFGMVGQSMIMQKVYNRLLKASSTLANVLITGESGTGKELAARAVHYGSSRSKAPFVAVNCGGIPESLLESELFGYVKGAFSGANETRMGFFEAANGGTIFLDEISETALSFQVKLLRVVQDKQLYMIGSRTPKTVDVRIITATNKNLPDLIEENVFRNDLYYRLNVISLELPPLRERKGDIQLLINYFINKYCKEAKKDLKRITDAALTVLTSYDWPGNVRELENIIQRVVVMSDDEFIDTDELPILAGKRTVSSLSKGDRLMSLNEVEMNYIAEVLAYTSNNKTKAAQILGIDRKTLWDKLKKK